MFLKKNLPNGLKIISAPMRGTKTATILVMIGTGSKYENKRNNGVSHFLEHMFFKGTKKRPTALAISSALDSLGAEYNAFTGKEYTGYWVKTAAEKIKPAAEIIADMLINSKLDEEEINRERGVILEELNMYLDNPMYHIEDIFESLLYGDTPAGWDTIGTRESLNSLKREDFADYITSQYGPANTTIVVAGELKNARSLELAIRRQFAGRALNDRGKDFKEKEAVRESQSEPAARIFYKKTDQAHISLGVRAFGYAHADRLKLKLLSIILGGSMSSRLFSQLREREGLAYYVRANTELYTDAGYFTARAGVPIDKIEKAVGIILAEYRKIAGELIPAAELKRAKDMLRGRITLQMESSDAVADWYGRQAVMKQTINRMEKANKAEVAYLSPEKYIKEIEKIKAGDLKKLAQRLFVSSGLNLAVIGPYDKSENFIGLLVI